MATSFFVCFFFFLFFSFSSSFSSNSLHSLKSMSEAENAFLYGMLAAGLSIIGFGFYPVPVSEQLRVKVNN